MAKKERKLIITPIFRVMFPAVFTPKKPMKKDDGSEGVGKYGVTALFHPKTFSPDDKKRWANMKTLADALSLETFRKPLDKLPRTFKLPFRDGSEKEEQYPDFEGGIFMNITSKMKPGIVASDGVTPVEDVDGFYAGCYARASVTLYSFDNAGKGIAFGLNNLKFVKHGARLDGRTDADKDFEDLGEEDLGGEDNNADDMI